jgi:hypothetical protein
MFKFKDQVIIENCVIGPEHFPVPKQPAYVALIFQSEGSETAYGCRPLNWTHGEIISYGLVVATVSLGQIRYWDKREARNERRVYDLTLPQPKLAPDFFDELNELDFFGELDLLPKAQKIKIRRKA